MDPGSKAASKMVRPFDTTYNGEDAALMERPAPAATAPPHEGDFDNPATNANLIEFIFLGDRENYGIRADKSAILTSKSELSRIYERDGSTAVRSVGENRFAVTENNRSNFELFIR